MENFKKCLTLQERLVDYDSVGKYETILTESKPSDHLYQEYTINWSNGLKDFLKDNLTSISEKSNWPITDWNAEKYQEVLMNNFKIFIKNSVYSFYKLPTTGTSTKEKLYIHISKTPELVIDTYCDCCWYLKKQKQFVREIIFNDISLNNINAQSVGLKEWNNNKVKIILNKPFQSTDAINITMDAFTRIDMSGVFMVNDISGVWGCVSKLRDNHPAIEYYQTLSKLTPYLANNSQPLEVWDKAADSAITSNLVKGKEYDLSGGWWDGGAVGDIYLGVVGRTTQVVEEVKFLAHGRNNLNLTTELKQLEALDADNYYSFFDLSGTIPSPKVLSFTHRFNVEEAAAVVVVPEPKFPTNACVTHYYGGQDYQTSMYIYIEGLWATIDEDDYKNPFEDTPSWVKKFYEVGGVTSYLRYDMSGANTGTDNWYISNLQNAGNGIAAKIKSIDINEKGTQTMWNIDEDSDDEDSKTIPRTHFWTRLEIQKSKTNTTLADDGEPIPLKSYIDSFSEAKKNNWWKNPNQTSNGADGSKRAEDFKDSSNRALTTNQVWYITKG